uniref:Uncharacterized protein n=1 Tax=Lygus hesperus TaxID=30085 RepID=A0A0K8SMA6_LYGHE
MDTRTFKHDGNENADILAKEGSRLRFIGPSPAIGVSKNACKEKVKKWETQDLNILWSKETDKYRQTRMLITSFDPKQASWLTSKSRNTIRIMTGILTGHYDFRRMLNIMDERVSPASMRTGRGYAEVWKEMVRRSWNMHHCLTSAKDLLTPDLG